MSNLSVISYGGGVQSTALVVLATQDIIDADIALFANVGDDSEFPDTLDYVRNVITPWAAERGVKVHELKKRMIRGDRKGEIETVYSRLTRPGSKSIPIPLRGSEIGKPSNRSCTTDFKIKVVGRWLKTHGATAENQASVAIGISVDEYQRATSKITEDYESVHYPLLDMRISRAECAEILRGAGLPVPPKSACYFCPLARPSRFAELRRDRPDLFLKAADLEALLNNRRHGQGKDPLYLTRFGKPLTEAIPVAQDALFGFDEYGMDTDECDEGYCFV